MSKFLKAVFTAVLFAGPVLAQPLGLGRAALPKEVAAWDTDVRPDGQGLPTGSGNAYDGEEIFATKCAVCHGDFAEGADRWPALAGGQDTLTDERPVRTIGSYWPYLTTAWDYIYRAMPYGDAASLSVDETYALVAYLLLVNDIIDDDEFELNQSNLAGIALPNAVNFRLDDRAETELSLFRDACLVDCKDSVEILRRASGVDVTPDVSE
jgi:S-disulfanyl-L-cysteine oxidoreductase SoxD